MGRPAFNIFSPPFFFIRLASAPRDALDGASARIKQILSKPFEKDSPAEKKVKDGVKKVVTDFLDYGELAKRSMGKNWNDRTPAEKKEFVGLLQDLIEASYLNKITGNADYTVDFLDETEEDGDALINTNLKAKSGSINVGFRLHQVGDKWMCFDLLIDDVSTLRNYKGEFNKIIKDKGYDGLVKRMKEKAAEIKKD